MPHSDTYGLYKQISFVSKNTTVTRRTGVTGRNIGAKRSIGATLSQYFSLNHWNAHRREKKAKDESYKLTSPSTTTNI